LLMPPFFFRRTIPLFLIGALAACDRHPSANATIHHAEREITQALANAGGMLVQVAAHSTAPSHKGSSSLRPTAHAGGGVNGFEHCPEFFYQGVAPAMPDGGQWQARALCYDAFAVYHSGRTHTPLFVAEHLTPEHLKAAKGESRTNKFFADARLPSAERAELDDYKGSGYDRGHMAPAGDMLTDSAMAQSFSLANMVPQAPENNRGVWAKSVEKAVRNYVQRTNDDVYVITGPVFDDGHTADSNMSRVWVPSYLYKLVYDPAKGKAWAYWVPNQNNAQVDGTITYKELTERLGVSLLPGLG
jgi:endonuclease G